LESIDCCDLQRYVHERNVVCSRNLLQALKASHPELAPEEVQPDPIDAEPDIEPTPLPPIPNEVIAKAADIAFPTWVNAVKRIQKAVCDEYGVSLVDLCSSRRNHRVVRPRQVAMYLCKTLTSRSLPEIGRRFGGRDHSTALSAIRRIEIICEKDEAFRARVERVAEQVGGLVAG
jgi:chromosomal replication initiator protein